MPATIRRPRMRRGRKAAGRTSSGKVRMSLGRRLIVASLVIGVNGCSSVPPDIARHRPLAKAYEKRFPVGAAVEPAQLDTRAGQLLAWDFHSVTAQNAMK